MSLASKTFSSLPQNSIVSIARPMDSAAAFAAGSWFYFCVLASLTTIN
jgi:hypothetical protein